MNRKNVNIEEYERLDLSNGLLVIGFPGLTLTGTITAEYLIRALNLREIGIIVGDIFPPAITVSGGKITAPIRICVGECGRGYDKIVVMSSITIIDDKYAYPMAKIISDWIKEKEISLSVLIVGAPGQGPDVLYIATTEYAKSVGEMVGLSSPSNAVIYGFPAALLLEASRRDVDLILLLVKAREKTPDAEAASDAVKVISHILEMDINTEPLVEEIKALEENLKNVEKMRRSETLGGGVSYKYYR